MFIDTHAHLWFEDYKYDLDEVIKRANENGVDKFIVPGTDIESSRKAIELAKKYPGVVYTAVGVHPEELIGSENSYEETPPAFGVPTRPLAGSPVEESPLVQLQELLGGSDLIKAIGEIGTDASTLELKNCMDGQKELFKAQCELAVEHDLPIIVHTRESLSEALLVLDSLPKLPRGQFHCFSHDEEGIKEVLKRGFYVSFCGNISWSKRVAKLVSLVPDDKLLLETDSPLMVPRDKKGEPISGSSRNEPANVVYLAKLIADLRGQSIEKIAEITTENATRLFHL
jgi:TatD DNase family protein